MNTPLCCIKVNIKNHILREITSDCCVCKNVKLNIHNYCEQDRFGSA